MAIVKVKKNTNFVITHRFSVQDERLTFEARGLYTYLHSLPADWEINVHDLVNRSPSGRDRVYRMLSELKAYRYLFHRHPRDEKGKLLHAHYELHSEPTGYVLCLLPDHIADQDLKHIPFCTIMLKKITDTTVMAYWQEEPSSEEGEASAKASISQQRLMLPPVCPITTLFPAKGAEPVWLTMNEHAPLLDGVALACGLITLADIDDLNHIAWLSPRFPEKPEGEGVQTPVPDKSFFCPAPDMPHTPLPLTEKTDTYIGDIIQNKQITKKTAAAAYYREKIQDIAASADFSDLLPVLDEPTPAVIAPSKMAAEKVEPVPMTPAVIPSVNEALIRDVLTPAQSQRVSALVNELAHDLSAYPQEKIGFYIEQTLLNKKCFVKTGCDFNHKLNAIRQAIRKGEWSIPAEIIQAEDKAIQLERDKVWFAMNTVQSKIQAAQRFLAFHRSRTDPTSKKTSEIFVQNLQALEDELRVLTRQYDQCDAVSVPADPVLTTSFTPSASAGRQHA